MDKLLVIKAGGKLLEDAPRWKALLRELATLPHPFVLVHGGGNRASQVTEALGGTPKMVDGRRITTDLDLEVALMVYAGLMNKQLVAWLQACGRNAIGLSGADGNSILSEKRPVLEHDFGWVGDVKMVNAAFFSLLLKNGQTPVCCAITHDGNGQLLNTNADTIAASVAKSMTAEFDVSLTYLFEKPGVLADDKDDSSVIAELTHSMYELGKASGQFHSGMLPKLHTAFEALEAGVSSVRITHPENWKTGGTVIKA